MRSHLTSHALPAYTSCARNWVAPKPSLATPSLSRSYRRQARILPRAPFTLIIITTRKPARYKGLYVMPSPTDVSLFSKKHACKGSKLKARGTRSLISPMLPSSPPVHRSLATFVPPWPTSTTALNLTPSPDTYATTSTSLNHYAALHLTPPLHMPAMSTPASYVAKTRCLSP